MRNGDELLATAEAVRDGEPVAGLHDPLVEQLSPHPTAGRVLFWIAVAFSVFQIATAAHVDRSAEPDRAGAARRVPDPARLPARRARARLGAVRRGSSPGRSPSVGVAVALYQWIDYAPLLLRAGDPLARDLAVGTLAIALVFVGTWMVMGPALPIIAGLFLAYCLFGEHLPSPLNHRGYDVEQVIDHMAYGTEGLYGIPIYVSSTYIFLFILFGSFLERAGMIKLFTDVSLGLVGHRLGGPAKVSVISSGLMGTISGSGVANVVTTGQFTIPLMKKFGYRAAFAGGVESTASMGGQLMPPVMGAVAFIMAETLGVEYVEVVKAALIPAVLYFTSALWMVHLEAGTQRARPACRRRSCRRRSRRCGSAGTCCCRSIGARLPPVHRLHAAVRRHRGARADRAAGARRLGRARAAGRRRAHGVLDRARARRGRLLRVRPAAGRRGDRAC